MKIELVSYSKNVNACTKCSIMKKVIINSTSDIILFPGSSIDSEKEFYSIVQACSNCNVKIVFEISDLKKIIESKKNKQLSNSYSGKGYFIDMSNCPTNLPKEFRQRFSTGSELQQNQNLFVDFYEEWESGLRTFVSGGKRFTILMCGETAMLRCRRNGGKLSSAEFRFKDSSLQEKYQKILDGTDVFLNMIHTNQGEQGVMKRKRNIFSADGKYYFSTATYNGLSGFSKSKSLQYAVYNGGSISPIECETKKTDEYISKVFEI